MKFTEILEAMMIWRNQDHEDFMTLSRNEVIELLEGYYKLIHLD